MKILCFSGSFFFPRTKLQYAQDAESSNRVKKEKKLTKFANVEVNDFKLCRRKDRRSLKK